MRVAFYTLGCKVNQNETAALEELFRAAGFLVVPPNQPADVFVVNSCTVTAGGDAKSRRALHRARRQNPGVVTVLCGCSPQAFPAEAAATGADVITGTAQRGRLLANIQEFLATGVPVVDIAPHQKGEKFEELGGGGLPAGRTRAFVKVQDGCNRRCAYCIIPTARGHSRSRAQASVTAEVAALVAGGVAEVVFTGINLPSYGQDTGTDLSLLAQHVAQHTGIARIRLSSLDPDLLDDGQIARLAQNPALCPHFHLSLQSGCDATLRAMRRPYTTAQYAAVVAALRAAFGPGASFTTDVIVGFPGETEQHFAESVAFVRQMEFLKVHVFPFSARRGTAAASFAGQLPRAEKAARAAAMQAAADAVRARWLAAQAGTHHQLLLETPLPDGSFTGYTKSYIPVRLAAPGATQGDMIAVRLGAFDGERCAATACPTAPL